MTEHGEGATPPGGSGAAAIERPVSATLARHLLLMVERVTDGFVALDRDFLFVHVNARAGELFGRDPASLIGRCLWDEFPAASTGGLRPIYERAMATQEPARFEENLGIPGRWFERRIYPSADGLSVFFTDVTDQRRAEDALRAREERYRLVAGSGSTMLFEFTIATGEVWREGGLLTSLGYGPEANGESMEWWMERIHPEDRPISDRVLEQTLNGTRESDEASFAYRLASNDGSYVAVTGRSRLIRDADGRPRSVVGVVSDARERRAMEDALRESEARFRAFVEQASDAVIVLDADATFRYVSPSLTRMLGHEPEALAGRSAFELVHVDDIADARATFAQGLTTPGIAQRVELRVQHADATWRHVEASGRALEADGTISGVLVHLRDATERQAADRALRDSEALFRTLADSSPVGIFQSDLDGGATYVNRRLTQLVGLSAPEMMGPGWSSRVHPDDRDALWTKWSEAVRSVVEFEHEYRFCLPDGAVRWVQARATPVLDASGTPTGTVGTIVDLTERRRLEQQLLHSQKLDAVGQLSGGIAHDFNNLLTVIQANVGLARGAAGPEVQVELDEISAAAARAAQLTRQLLAFSRRQVLQPRLLDLNTVVLDAERLLRRLLGAHIVVETVLAPDLWRARADAGQMEQVLMNLAVNARDAMAGGGTLTIETANVPAGDAPSARDTVRLRVRDSGTGMAPEVRDRAFEPFFTTKAPGVGTGLGLAMVYGIVTQSGGTVELESTAGVGSEFTVLLPRADADAAAPSPVLVLASAPAVGGHERILLVEDETAVRGVARRILERAGYAVVEARHGADALLVWREARGEVDLVLTDVRMPEMGGFELVAALRAERPDVTVVVMSGYADAGAPGNTEWFLEKPFSRETLMRIVRRALDGERPDASGIAG